MSLCLLVIVGALVPLPIYFGSRTKAKCHPLADTIVQAANRHFPGSAICCGGGGLNT